MKNRNKHINSKKGMTYVEVLVALSILALVVVVFTPILMYSYEKLYTAGEINVETYEIKSYIEESLAIRSNDPKVKAQFGLQGLSEHINMVMRRITGAVDGLETLYGVPKSNVAFLGDDILIDNTSTHSISMQFIDFEDLTNESFIKSHSPGRGQVSYIIETPTKDEANLDGSKYSIDYDDLTKSAVLTIKNIDITYSPLRIIVRFHDASGKVRAAEKHIDIKPANMMFVGAADGNTAYYTTAGLDDNNQISLEARSMTGGGISSGTKFNKVTWVTTGADKTGAIGYYAMCGNGGSIRRIWLDKEDGHNKYSWSGDNTEVYTYGADFNSSNKTVSDVSANPATNRGTVAASLINYNGLYLNSGISVKNCIQISNNISTNAEAKAFLAKSGRDGMYFYTASDENFDSSLPSVPKTLKRDMKVNWEDNDSRSPYGTSGTQYGQYIYANYINGNKYHEQMGDVQPVVFFATTTAGNRDTDGGNSNKGGRATAKNSASQINRIFLMTNNNPGSWRVHRSGIFYRWQWLNDANGQLENYHASSFGSNAYSNHGCSECDKGALFSQSPIYPAPHEVKFHGKPNGVVPDIENSTFSNDQKQLLRYIINTFSDGVRVLSSDTKSFIGKTDTTAKDINIPYVRLKGYTNTNAGSLAAAFSTLTNTNSYKSAVLDNNIKNPNAETIKGMTNLELTDMCIIDDGTKDDGEEKGFNYIGYTQASAYINATVLTSVHKDENGNNSSEQGYIRPFVIRGVDESSYEIAKLPATDTHWANESSLPVGTLTGEDTNTAFTLGYSSNRSLLFSTAPPLENRHKFSHNNVEDSSLKLPDDFTNYLSYAQDDDITIAVGYKTVGSVEFGKFETEGGCTQHALDSPQIGDRPIYINNNFFFNTQYSPRSAHPENPQNAQIAFKDTNEDINIGTAANPLYCRGYFLEAANLKQSGAAPTAYVLQKTNCAATYTTLGFKTGAATDQPIVNVGTIAVHFAGSSSFRNIYTAPSTDERLFDSRFTCAAVGTTTVAVGDNVSTYYKAYIGDSKGNIWCIPQLQESDADVKLASYTVGSTLLDSAGTGMSSITKIYLTGNRLIIIGKLATDQTKTKMIIIEQTLVDPEDPESALNPPEIKVNITHSYTLHDIAEHNGVLYAIGTTTSGSAGVILYSAEPTDSSVGWTAVTTAKNASGGNTPLKPLYSFATTGNTEEN
ncbi:MAG TPA: hypothetical protein VFC76_09340 [Oscillospiraceae bacterium]|nr:hypothetical protein [Oscillospiraceae bacterium]